MLGNVGLRKLKKKLLVVLPLSTWGGPPMLLELGPLSVPGVEGEVGLCRAAVDHGQASGEGQRRRCRCLLRRGLLLKLIVCRLLGELVAPCGTQDWKFVSCVQTQILMFIV